MKRRNLYAKAVTRIRPQVVPDKRGKAKDAPHRMLMEDALESYLAKQWTWEKAQSPFKQGRIVTETGEREDV